MVCLLFVFRSILSGEREDEKFFASYKIGCNVNLKHTCIKTGAGGGSGQDGPEGAAGLRLLLAGSEPPPDVPFLAEFSHPSRTSQLPLPFPRLSMYNVPALLPGTRTEHCDTIRAQQESEGFLQQPQGRVRRWREPSTTSLPPSTWDVLLSLHCQQEDNFSTISP